MAEINAEPLGEDIERGILLVEGRLKNDNHLHLAEELSSRIQVEISVSKLQRDAGVDILKDEDAKDILGDVYDEASLLLEFLRIVDCDCHLAESEVVPFEDFEIHVKIYNVFHNQPSFTELSNAKVTSLPHEKLEGFWEQLVFNNDVKTYLIRMISNARFLADHGEEDTNPVILLHGPPGTGKSTLCRALAQKISIRISAEYHTVKLIEFKPASLLSKFYSESGQQVETLFQQICDLCSGDPDTFYCILIDEVESIARSRHKTAQHGEVEDSQRVTCELLKGIDNLKEHHNFIVLATTNFFEDLDSAFLSRCAQDEMIETPAPFAQYKILTDLLDARMDKGIITSEERLPSYQAAKFDQIRNANDGSNGFKLLKIIDRIQTLQSQSPFGWAISGRSLGLLLRTALQRNLRGKSCTLDEAFAFIDLYITEKLSRKRAHDFINITDDDNENEHDEYSNVLEFHSKNQKKRYSVQWEGDFDERAFLKYTNTLRADATKRRIQFDNNIHDLGENGAQENFLTVMVRQVDRELREEKLRKAQMQAGIEDFDEIDDDDIISSSML